MSDGVLADRVINTPPHSKLRGNNGKTQKDFTAYDSFVRSKLLGMSPMRFSRGGRQGSLVLFVVIMNQSSGKTGKDVCILG